MLQTSNEEPANLATNPISARISQSIPIPSWLLTLGIGLVVGVVAGPAIMASTEAGGKYLERQVRERVK